MKKLFSSEGRIFQLFEKLFDIVFMSALWLLFSVPLITIGASTTALYYAATKVFRNNRGYMFQEFFRAFRSNFLQSTLIWILCVGFEIFIRADFKALDYINNGSLNAFYTVFRVAGFYGLLVFFIALCYVARFEQKTLTVLANSVIMSIRHLPWTCVLFAIFLLGISLYLINPALLILAPGTMAVLSSLVLERIFARYMSPEDLEAEMLRNHPESIDRDYIQINHAEFTDGGADPEDAKVESADAEA